MAAHFDRLQTKDDVLNRVQDRLKTVINPIADALLVGARIVKGLTAATDAYAITTAFQNIAHGFGRAPSGWLPVSPDAPAIFWEDVPANNPDPAKFIRVKASVAVNVKFLVF